MASPSPPLPGVFDVKGQKGSMPPSGFGTATLKGAVCVAAVRAAIKSGYRAIDTALLYDNQKEVGIAVREAIAAGEVTREELFITTKVGFYPASASPDNVWVPISMHENNRKGQAATAAAIDECLALLGLPSVDLLLIHNPATGLADYAASCAPHFFELSKSGLTAAERRTVLEGRLATANAAYDEAKAEADRASTWLALEHARAAGRAKFIGVSNYSPDLLRAMSAYATVHPCVNQIEFHPRFSSPSLRALAAESGMALTAYGSGNSVAIEKCPIIKGIAEKRACGSLAVVLQWTLQRGVCVIPRTATPAHMVENQLAGSAAATPLTAEELAAIDAKNEAHPYYWHPLPFLKPGSRADC